LPTFPQGLKPATTGGIFGADKALPFQNDGVLVPCGERQQGDVAGLLDGAG